MQGSNGQPNLCVLEEKHSPKSVEGEARNVADSQEGAPDAGTSIEEDLYIRSPTPYPNGTQKLNLGMAKRFFKKYGNKE